MDDVTIEEIAFNHDLKPADMRALRIRKNEQADIELPEWKAGKNRSPAAYARTQGNTLTIAVKLRRHNQKVKSVTVSAKSGGVLGNVSESTIYFQPGQTESVGILNLEGARITEFGVGKREVIFKWTLLTSLDRQATSVFTPTTKHDIYILLAPPNPPWGPDPFDPDYEWETPWADVLDIACEWAAGATDKTAVASMITRKLYFDCRLKFSETETFSRLSFNGTDAFDCTKFLTQLKSSDGPEPVNCSDCAVLVSSFSNILGCDLYQSQMGYKFWTNPIRMIGSDTEDAREFRIHEVAWEYPCTSEANLFDCCLQVDGDSRPMGGKFEPMLGINIPLGNQKGTGYHFRLVQPGQPDECCQARPEKMIRRRIRRLTIRALRIDPAFEELLKKEYDFSSWGYPAETDRLFHGTIESLLEGFSPAGWQLQKVRTLSGESNTPDLSESFWQSLTSATALRLLAYKCPKMSDARTFLLNLLGDFQFPIISRMDDLEAKQHGIATGEITFSGPQDRVLLFTRANLVLFIQNASLPLTSVLTFGEKIDVSICERCALAS